MTLAPGRLLSLLLGIDRRNNDPDLTNPALLSFGVDLRIRCRSTQQGAREQEEKALA